MSGPVLIGPVGRSTPSGRAARADVPDDLLRAASRRLGIIAVLGAALWIIGTAMSHLVEAPLFHIEPLQFVIPDAIAGGCVAVSLALFFYARRPDRDPRTVLDLGLGYMILTGFAIGQTFHWYARPPGPVMPQMSWSGIITLIFAAILPITPKKMLIAGFVTVTMNPLGMLIAKARGHWDFGPNINVLVMHYPDYVLAGVAVVIAHVVTRLGREVARAREMGSYRLGELLGRGGMGEVYRATHRMLARQAAIKLIRPDMTREGSGALAETATLRFRREAEVAASLRSPHTVELYDFGVTADNTLYLVMEYLEGLDLEALVREHGPLPAGRLIFILRQICESLDEAHARGLVHRDIKPANIHVGRLGLRHDFVKVLDFGLVKLGSGGDADALVSTAAGSPPGTPAYMAPEIVKGGAVDGRADIYSLGCVAYFGLTGKLVFEGQNAYQVIAKHAYDEPVPPSRRTELTVPAALDGLVLACLRKDPADRPDSVAALSCSLAAIEVEPWTEERARDWWQLHAPRAAQG